MRRLHSRGMLRRFYRDPATCFGRETCIPERVQLGMFGVVQLLLSTAIFAATFAEKSKGMNVGAVTQMSDEFTLWTNTLLFVNGLSNLFLGRWAERLNLLNHQMQAALLPATIFLGIAMRINTQYLGVKVVEHRLGVGAILVQHVPSIGAAIVSSRFYGMKTSGAFEQASFVFFAVRALYATQYLLRDAISHYAAYPAFDFFQDEIFNPSALGFTLGCFAINLLFMNVMTYTASRGLEAMTSCFQETSLFKKHCNREEDLETGGEELRGPTITVEFAQTGF